MIRATTLAFLASCALLIAAGCQPQTDLDKEKAALVQVERDFAAMSAREGYIEAYNHYLADDAFLLPPGAEIRVGRERIYREDLEQGLQGVLEWETEAAEVARSADLGWTWGRWVFTVKGEDGGSRQSRGKYVFVWRRPAGQWKVAANIWNADPGPE